MAASSKSAAAQPAAPDTATGQDGTPAFWQYTGEQKITLLPEGALPQSVEQNDVVALTEVPTGTTWKPHPGPATRQPDPIEAEARAARAAEQASAGRQEP